jgi:hypothetical protein
MAIRSKSTKRVPVRPISNVRVDLPGWTVTREELLSPPRATSRSGS